MGTINYRTSKFITMGINPYDVDDVRKGMIDNIDCYDGLTVEDIENDDDYVYEEINEYYSCDRINFEATLKKYDFDVFNVSLEYGYYEGLYVDIDIEYCYFDNYQEKRDAQKEITRLKDFLIEIAGMGFVACYPFWVTSYEDYKGTLKAINEAVKEMRKAVKDIPTARDYWKNWKIA